LTRSDRTSHGGTASRRLPLPSPALVVASLALLVSLGGVGYAAVMLPKNSVGAPQIRNDAVTAAKVRDGSLSLLDLGASARRALTGPAGAPGAPGPKGDPGVGGVEIVQASSPFFSGDDRTVTVDCPAGKRVIGGGGGAWGRAMIWITKGIALTASHPLDDDTWLAAAHEIVPTDEEWFLRVAAVCVAA